MSQQDPKWRPQVGRASIVLGLDSETLHRLQKQAERNLRPVKHEALRLIVRGLEGRSDDEATR